jgi:predicted tellurium resistance membrane protein TerC
MLADQQILLSLLSLIAMELVLGIDNIIFISILTSKLPTHLQPKARNLGISLAVVARIGLLFMIGLILQLQTPLITWGGFALTGKDLVLFLGGVFLTIKTVIEILQKVTPPSENPASISASGQFASIIFQIVLIDLIFSVDSILTAIGLVDAVWMMVVAVVISSLVMVAFASPIHRFIQRYPGFKLMALLFLIIIGGFLILESFHLPVVKAYLYFSMAFGLIYEALHIRYRKFHETGA